MGEMIPPKASLTDPGFQEYIKLLKEAMRRSNNEAVQASNKYVARTEFLSEVSDNRGYSYDAKKAWLDTDPVRKDLRATFDFHSDNAQRIALTILAEKALGNL